MAKKKTKTKPSSHARSSGGEGTRPNGGNGGERPGRVLRPRADVYETDGGYGLVLDMPGVDEGSTEVSYGHGVLMVRARCNTATAPEGYAASRQERKPGLRERSFALDQDVDVDRSEARYSDGVLHLTLPKVDGAAARIPITRG